MMRELFAVVYVVALLGVFVCLLAAAVQKIRKKPAKNALKRTGVCAIVMMAALIAYGILPAPPDSTADRRSGQAQPDPAEDAAPAEPAPAVQEPVSQKEPDAPGNTNAPEDTNAPAQPSAAPPDAGPAEDGAYIGDDIYLRNITDFSGGRAWVEFKETDRKKGSLRAARDAVNAALSNTAGKILYGLANLNSEGNYRAGIIDPQGQLVWESPLTNNSSVLLETSDFQDGLAYCMFNGNDGRLWMAVNSGGDIVFSRPDSEDFQILGCGGGYLLMAEHTANFSTNAWTVGAIDTNGNIAMPFQEFERAALKNSDPEPLEFGQHGGISYLSCTYLGEGVFQLSFLDYYVLLNVESQRVIRTEPRIGQGDGRIEDFLTGFENGSAVILYNDEKTDYYGDYRVIGLRSIGTLSTDGTLTPGDSNEWVQWTLRTDSMTFSEGLAFFDPDFVLTGSTHSSEGVYCDYLGREVVRIPAYQGKHVYTGDPFYGGYAAMFVYGADGNAYATVIDKNGDVMFEPRPGYSAIYTSADGKYATVTENGAVTVLDIHGEPLLRVDYSKITPGNIYDSTIYNVRDGVLRVKDFYVNVESGAVIGLHGETDPKFSVTKY